MTTNYADIFEIERLVVTKLSIFEKSDIRITLKKKIPYGTQLYVSKDDSEGLINIYYSKKKGLSFVDCSSNAISSGAIKLFSGVINSLDDIRDLSVVENEFNCWIGTDESGKGDFFGPLVVAGFLAKRDIENELSAIGVTDSKKLKSEDIHKIASTLKDQYSENFVVKVYENRSYNAIYQKYSNLNYLLADGHAEVIQQLLDRWEKDLKVDGVVADKFADESLIRKALGKSNNFELIQRTKGESNLAVAAASILARAAFEDEIFAMSDRYDVKIPFGASGKVKVVARKLMKKMGRPELINAVKTHFKTFREL